MIKITESNFSWLPRRAPRSPRERYVTYYRDLYSLYGDTLSTETFFSDSQYSYAELGDSVLMQCEKANSLADIDLLLIANWSYEFDPDYASCSAYFAHKYKIKKMIMDVGDQGTMALFTAMKIIQKYIESNQDKKVALLFLEQKTIPRNINAPSILPVFDAASIIFFQNKYEKNQERNFYEVVSLGIIEKGAMHSLSDFIVSLCQLYKIDSQFLTIITKSNADDFNVIKTKNIINKPGVIPCLSYIDDLVHQRDCIHYGLFLEQDAETNDMGYLVLRRV